MKNYLVIGNPIDHSLSPKLHNTWLKTNNINAFYDKQKLEEKEIENFIQKIKQQKIAGANVTVPFKKKVIPFLDKLSFEAKKTQSVNTIVFENNNLVGHNTDVIGFTRAIKDLNFNIKGSKIFILGAGGVVPSIIFSLQKSGISEITLSNRTKNKADELKNTFPNLKVVEWGKIPEFDIVINATSLGLNKHDKINLKFININKDKLFYDVIYNPMETDFLKNGKKLGAEVLNGKMMFVYQASEAFKLWHKINPEVNQEVLALLEQ